MPLLLQVFSFWNPNFLCIVPLSLSVPPGSTTPPIPTAAPRYVYNLNAFWFVFRTLVLWRSGPPHSEDGVTRLPLNFLASPNSVTRPSAWILLFW